MFRDARSSNRNNGGIRWRTERAGICWLCRGLKGRIINLFPDENMGDALVEVHNTRIYLECVSTYDYCAELHIPTSDNNFSSYSQSATRRIFARLQMKIDKRYSDNRSLLVIVDHAFPFGKRTLAHNATLMRSYDLTCFPYVYMIELLTKTIHHIK